MNDKKIDLLYIIVLIIGLIVAFLALFPLAWMMVSGFKPEKEVLSVPFTFLPSAWVLDNYKRLFKDTTFPFDVAMKNTAFVATVAALLSITINSMAGYAYARLDFTFKKILWRITIFTMYIPGITILLTSFVLVNKLGMLDTFSVLIVPGLASAYSIFFFRQFFFDMPMSIEDAALIDGASRFRIFIQIFLPNAKSPYVIMGTGAFLGYWNSFLWPTMTITSKNYIQIMQVIRSYNSMYASKYGTVLAGSTLAALPPILLFMALQKHIIKGIVISGIK